MSYRLYFSRDFSENVVRGYREYGMFSFYIPGHEMHGKLFKPGQLRLFDTPGNIIWFISEIALIALYVNSKKHLYSMTIV